MRCHSLHWRQFVTCTDIVTFTDGLFEDVDCGHAILDIDIHDHPSPFVMLLYSLLGNVIPHNRTLLRIEFGQFRVVLFHRLNQNSFNPRDSLTNS